MGNEQCDEIGVLFLDFVLLFFFPKRRSWKSSVDHNGLSGLLNSHKYVPDSFHDIIPSHPTDSYRLEVWSQLCQGSSTVGAKNPSWASSLPPPVLLLPHTWQ